MTVVPEQEHDPEFDYLIPPPRPRLLNLNIAAQGTVLTSEKMGKDIIIIIIIFLLPKL